MLLVVILVFSGQMARDVHLAVTSGVELVVANRPNKVLADFIEDHREVPHLVRESFHDLGEFGDVG